MLIVIGNRVIDPRKQPVLIVVDAPTQQDIADVNTAETPCYYQFGLEEFTRADQEGLEQLAREYDTKNCAGRHFKQVKDPEIESTPVKAHSPKDMTRKELHNQLAILGAECKSHMAAVTAVQKRLTQALDMVRTYQHCERGLKGELRATAFTLRALIEQYNKDTPPSLILHLADYIEQLAASDRDDGEGAPDGT